MARYGVAEAKDNLSSLIDKALSGEEVLITRHGQPVVQLRAFEAEPSKISRREALERLAKLREEVGSIGISGGDLVRQMRDEYRY
jgi:antitoxin (DNA-binding transcriptional repressor) of toxin-antitoxin stability system